MAYESFAQTEIAHLEDMRLAALEERIEADLALRRHADVAAELERLARDHPLRERVRSQLMLALYRSGRQAEALEVYRQTRQALVDELGLEPSAELKRLEQAILEQDPSLDPPPQPSRRTETQTRPHAAAGVFVGRARELDELTKCLEEALSGSGRLVLLGGEPGIGKTLSTYEELGMAPSRPPGGAP